MKFSVKYLFLLLLISAGFVLAQESEINKALNSINIHSIQGQLEFLASDWTEGRETGTKGNFMAADYIASMFKVYGLKPGGDIETVYSNRLIRRRGERPERKQTYFQNFNLLAFEENNDQNFSVISKEGDAKNSIDFGYKTDFIVRGPAVGQEITAPVVFVGYGFTDKENGYDDFEDVDVKGKFILRLAGFPGYMDTTSEAYKKFHAESRNGRYYLTRDKNNRAEELGAVGVIEVFMGESNLVDSWVTNYPFRFNNYYYEGDTALPSPYAVRMMIPGDTLSNSLNQLMVTARAANEIIKGTGVSFSAFENYAKQKMEPKSELLKNKTIHLKTSVKSSLVKTRNVIGVLEGEDPDDYIVIGAHFDHIGKQGGYINNGADDNASGTVGMMTIAKAFCESGIKPKKTIVFAAWTGEEKGLLGSRYFTEHPYKPLKNLLVNLNFDMISRDSEDDSLHNECSMNYSSDYPVLEEMTKNFNDDYKLGLDIRFRSSKRPGGGSDHAPFAAKDVPIFYFMAGFHPEYHQPFDHVEKVNWNKMTSIVKLGFLNIYKIANSEGKIETAETQP